MRLDDRFPKIGSQGNDFMLWIRSFCWHSNLSTELWFLILATLTAACSIHDINTFCWCISWWHSYNTMKLNAYIIIANNKVAYITTFNERQREIVYIKPMKTKPCWLFRTLVWNNQSKGSWYNTAINKGGEGWGRKGRFACRSSPVIGEATAFATC